MKLNLRGFAEIIEWGFESLSDGLDKVFLKWFGIELKRRHILFGVLVLLISTLFVGLYIYQKNWVVVAKREAGRSEQQLTISLNGEDAAVQEMSEEIRDSILETPMAAASSSQASSQASAQSAARSPSD